MDGAAGDFHPRLQCLFLGIAALEGGEEWRMDVEDPVLPIIHEGLGEDPHEASKTNELHAPRLQDLLHGSLEGLPAVVVPVVHKLQTKILNKKEKDCVVCSRHRVIILLERACLHNRIGRNWCKFSTKMCNVTAWRHSKLHAHWQGAEGEFPGNCSVSYISFAYGRSLWAELNGGENSLHWKANMLPLFSIITLWSGRLLARWTGTGYSILIYNVTALLMAKNNSCITVTEHLVALPQCGCLWCSWPTWGPQRQICWISQSPPGRSCRGSGRPSPAPAK